jgi:hypothetical protein
MRKIDKKKERKKDDKITYISGKGREMQKLPYQWECLLS